MRFVISNRRAGKFQETSKLASRSAMSSAMNQLAAGANILSETSPSDDFARHSAVFEAEPGEVDALKQNLSSDVMIEPEIEHFSDTSTPMDFRGLGRQSLSAPLSGSDNTLNVKVTGGGENLKGAEVILYVRGLGRSHEIKEVTGANGKAEFHYPKFFSPSVVVVVPAGNYWSVFSRGPSSPMVVDCPPLPEDGPNAWWHENVGIDRYRATAGRGIRVGVIDSGLGPHPCLSHVTDIGSFIDGVFDPQGGADSGSHGTHVNGIIGAKPQSDGQFAGGSPGCKQYSARVFPPDRGANQIDIADAIDALSVDYQVDLINMSLGADRGSEIERDAIQDALERGTLCICAAGNDGRDPISYPAKFSETVAISALGLEGWGPLGTIASNRLPQIPQKFGYDNLYLANFSNFGDEIDSAAPGVGIIAPVPERYGLVAPFASMGGTSMASPLACATLAVNLAKSADYKALPRDKSRAEMAKRIFADSCRSVGLNRSFQGEGMPNC